MSADMSIWKLGRVGMAINRLRKYCLYGPRGDTRTYVREMNKLGASIDESLFMPTPESVFLDDTSPWLLTIGKNVSLAAGVKVLTHDASWLILKGVDGVIRGHMAPTRIGDNVFIGMNSIVLCGVTICDNVIIGVNSAVNRSIREPGVYSGVPARRTAELEQFQTLREAMQPREALTLAREYFRRFGKKPPQEIFHEYFWLFAPRNLETLPAVFLQKLEENGNFEQSRAAFLASQPDFAGYDDFWRWCREKIGAAGD